MASRAAICFTVHPRRLARRAWSRLGRPGCRCGRGLGARRLRRRCVDGLAASGVDRHVGDVAGAGAVEKEVAQGQLRALGQVGAGVVLVLDDAEEGDAGGVVGGLGQSGAVEAAVGGPVAAPDVGGAELGAGEGDRRGGSACGCVRLPRTRRRCAGPRRRTGRRGCRSRWPSAGSCRLSHRWRTAGGPRRRPRRWGPTGWAASSLRAAPGRRIWRRWTVGTAWDRQRPLTRPWWGFARGRSRPCRSRQGPSTKGRGTRVRRVGRGRAWWAGCRSGRDCWGRQPGRRLGKGCPSQRR